MMKKNRSVLNAPRLCSLCAAGILALTALPAPAFASSPEFARTEEEWNRLRDNKMEYGEIEGLVQEYNVTVQNNQYNYRKFREDYGDTNEEVAGAYYDLAMDFLNMMSNEDDAGSMMSDLSLQMQADNMLARADDTLEDSKIYLLTYEQAEKNIVATAQAGFINYYKLLLQKQQQEAAVSNAEESLNYAGLQRSAGMVTDLEVLNAQEARQKALDQLVQTERSIRSQQENLNVLLGWKHDDTPEMGELPPVDEGRVSRMDPAADLAAALENNYTLRINRRKLENARDGLTKENLQTAIANNERKIGNSLNSASRSVLTAQLQLQQARAALALAQQDLNLASGKLSAGMITQREYNTSARALQNAQFSVRSAELTLFTAMENYDWAVKGLAAAE